jgi:hypothetical protein
VKPASLAFLVMVMMVSHSDAIPMQTFFFYAKQSPTTTGGTMYCSWTPSSENGSCINTAIAAAAANGGGQVILPCGVFGFWVPILQQNSGVRLKGCGITMPGIGASATVLKCLQNAGMAPTIGVQIGPSSTMPYPSVSQADTEDFAVDGFSNCQVGIKFAGVAYSKLRVAAGNALSENILMSPVPLASPGNQHNEISLYAYVPFSNTPSAVNNATGIRIDNDPMSAYNTSQNIFHELYVFYGNGDGIVLGNSDNNVIESIDVNSGGTGQPGSPVVCANSAYQSPNGVSVNGQCNSTSVRHLTAPGIWVQGMQANTTIMPSSGNSNHAVYTPWIMNITAPQSAQQNTLSLSLVSGSLPTTNMTAQCGGPANGIFDNDPVVSITGTTSPYTFTFFGQTMGNVSATSGSSPACSFGLNVTPTTLVGNYTLTYSSSGYTLTLPNLTTQGPVALTGNALTFPAMIIPWGGTTPVNGDTWAITVPTPSKWLNLENLDVGNHTAIPTFEQGASGTFRMVNQPLQYAWGLATTVDWGLLNSNYGIQSGGNPVIVTGCSASTVRGGGTTGQFAIHANSCSISITLNGAAQAVVSPNYSWACFIYDKTQPSLGMWVPSSVVANTVTFALPSSVANNDQMVFSCTSAY